MQNNKKLIGVITASAFLNEQRTILEGIISKAHALGASAAVFSNIYNSTEYFANVEIENKIYDLILSHKLDGIILNAESILNPELQQIIYKNIMSRTGTPVVVTGAQIDGMICINNDVESDIEDITNHLIQSHGFTDIHILTGFEYMETSHQRVNGYKNALISNGISFDESKVIYGDFWMNSGESLAMEYISGKRSLPQAIVCTNDYMAYGLCDVFLENGIDVPEKVSVVGYEYVGGRYFHAPILTTYFRNRKAVGEKAADLLLSMINHTEPSPISLQGYVIHGNSCGCCIDKKFLSDELYAVRREQYYSDLNLSGNFEQQLTLCRSVADYVDVLQQFAYLIRDIKGIYLCLYEDWCSSELNENSSSPIHNEVMACYTVICPEEHDDTPSFYNKYELYPDVIPDTGNGNSLYFCPIFFAGKEYGYFILQYDKPDCYDVIFRDWLKIASNALEFLRMKNDINTLLACNNLSSFHDSITGLYNETGLKNELLRTVKEIASGESIIMIMIRTELFSDDGSISRQQALVDLDMKIAQTMKKFASGKNEFCSKIADKLYMYTAAGEYTEPDAEIISDKLYSLINHIVMESEDLSNDSLAMCFCRFSAENFDYSDSISRLGELMNCKINLLSERRKHSGYHDYLKIRNELYRNPQQIWDSQEICRSLHISYGHFRAVYKEIFGISFHQDVIRSRIALAKYLLLTSVLSISAIAEKCGYDDDKYFLRQFRSITGLTTNEYKKGIEA